MSAGKFARQSPRRELATGVGSVAQFGEQTACTADQLPRLQKSSRDCPTRLVVPLQARRHEAPLAVIPHEPRTIPEVRRDVGEGQGFGWQVPLIGENTPAELHEVMSDDDGEYPLAQVAVQPERDGKLSKHDPLSALEGNTAAMDGQFGRQTPVGVDQTVARHEISKAGPDRVKVDRHPSVQVDPLTTVPDEIHEPKTTPVPRGGGPQGFGLQEPVVIHAPRVHVDESEPEYPLLHTGVQLYPCAGLVTHIETIALAIEGKPVHGFGEQVPDTVQTPREHEPISAPL